MGVPHRECSRKQDAHTRRLSSETPPETSSREVYLGRVLSSGLALSHSAAEWAGWLSQLAECSAAIRQESPDTLLFTTFQLERLKGIGRYNGWGGPPVWEPVDEMEAAGLVDALGFTSYPYFEYDRPTDVPADYYDEIAAHCSGPVIFTEIGWLGAPSGPYPGDEQDQAGFFPRFFELGAGLDLVYAVWLFLHDWDGQDAMPAFRYIGLRTNDGTPRPADAVWRNAVERRE